MWQLSSGYGAVFWQKPSGAVQHTAAAPRAWLIAFTMISDHCQSELSHSVRDRTGTRADTAAPSFICVRCR